MKIYIAGRISKDPEYKIKFDHAEWILRDRGYDVVNPANNAPPKGTEWTYRKYIDAGLKQLMTCDVIFLLPGWQSSDGALLEHSYAKITGMGIWHQDSWEGWRVER